MAYDAAGDSKPAALFLRRALHGLERAAGPQHPDVAAVLRNLAALHAEQCAYAQAERLSRRALAIMRPVDSDDAEVQRLRVYAFGHMGRLCQVLGRYDEAEALLRQALTLAEHQLGCHHLEVAALLNTLGMLYKYMGRFATTLAP